MKKRVILTTFVAALFLAMPTHAQFRFGPKAGVNISDLSLSGGWSGNFNSDNITSFTGGATCEFIAPLIGLGFDASVMYTRKGSKLKDIFGESTSTKHTDYIEIPINLKYKLVLPAVKEFIAPYVFAGPSFSFRVGDNFKEQYKNKSFETAINLGLGLELFERVQISGQYGWGLDNALRSQNEITGAVVRGKSRAWTFTAAYMFKLGK